MPPVAVIQQVEAPIEKVFNFIGDVTTHTQINDYCLNVKFLTEEHTGVGTRFHQVYSDGTEHESEVVVWEPYSKIVWRNFEAGGKEPVNIISYRFEQVENITYVLHFVEAFSLEDQAHHRDVTERNFREMKRLKEILEG